MLLKQFQKVFEIDNRISEMQKELLDLYKERTGIVDPETKTLFERLNPAARKVNYPAEVDVWTRAQHDRLFKAWQRYGIDIPPLTKLKAKLAKAHALITKISQARPEIGEGFSVLLVPPAKLLKFPLSKELRAAQGLNYDFVQENFPKVKGGKQWRLFVVFDRPAGIYLGSPRKILAEKSFVIGGIELNGLGPLEYAALTLQSPQLVDQGSWTMLLAGVKPKELVPCATFMAGLYRFELTDMDSVFGDDKFRPATEIK